MRVYKTQHSYYCGVDLHARSLFVRLWWRHPPRAKPAERRGFWGVTAVGDSRLSLVTPAGPVELFGTASVVTLACYCREMRCRLKNHPGTPSDHPVCKSQLMVP